MSKHLNGLWLLGLCAAILGVMALTQCTQPPIDPGVEAAANGPDPVDAPTAPTTVRRGFLCTGSMEPAMSCLDEITYSAAFNPEEISVGNIISFRPSCQGAEGTSHRVVKVKVEQGRHWYWPKGDAMREPDGCWIPASNVRGYVVEVHRDVRPANAELRTLVNEAKRRFDNVIDHYCGMGVEVQDCTVAPERHDEIMRVRAVLDCWQQVAIDSEYPGHIPRRC